MSKETRCLALALAASVLLIAAGALACIHVDRAMKERVPPQMSRDARLAVQPFDPYQYVDVDIKGVTVNIEPCRYFDIPLGRDLQGLVFSLSEQHGINPALVFAVIEVESGYMPNAIADSCYGLMQIVRHWTTVFHKDSEWDLLCPVDNITLGILILDYYQNGLGITDPRHLLIAYNGNEGYLRKMISKGVHETEYTRKVLKTKERLISEKGERI